MFKSHIPSIIAAILLLGLLTACGGQPSGEEMGTAVAATLEALPTQPQEEVQVIEITRVLEVTKIAVIGFTATPTLTSSASDTPAATETAESTLTPEQRLPAVTSTPTPVTETGPLGLSLNQLVRRYSDMTDLQKEEFAKTLPGKTVFWIAEVYNITSDGTIILDNPYGGGRVTLKGVTIDTAIDIDKGMLVEFRGMIESFGGSFGRDIVVANPEIVRYYFEPTPTPTATR